MPNVSRHSTIRDASAVSQIQYATTTKPITSQTTKPTATSGTNQQHQPQAKRISKLQDATHRVSVFLFFFYLSPIEQHIKSFGIDSTRQYWPLTFIPILCLITFKSFDPLSLKNPWQPAFDKVDNLQVPFWQSVNLLRIMWIVNKNMTRRWIHLYSP